MRAEIEYTDGNQRSVEFNLSSGTATSDLGEHSLVWLTALVPHLDPSSDPLYGTDSNGKFDVTVKTPHLDPTQYAVRGLARIDSKKPDFLTLIVPKDPNEALAGYVTAYISLYTVQQHRGIPVFVEESIFPPSNNLSQGYTFRRGRAELHARP